MNHFRCLCDREYDLDALTRAAGDLVAAAGVAQADGRVSDLPDARGVRYYQTLGLIGKPLRYDGRQAVYGYRHLLEVVAVKVLQAQGLSLAQVQQALAGTTTDHLEAAVADATRGRTDPPSPVPLPAAPDPRPSPGAGIDDRWPPTGGLPSDTPSVLPRPCCEPPTRRVRPRPPRRLVAAEVAPGVYVTIDPARVGVPGEVLEHIRRALVRPEGADE